VPAGHRAAPELTTNIRLVEKLVKNSRTIGAGRGVAAELGQYVRCPEKLCPKLVAVQPDLMGAQHDR
jgi:hypothetical protein